MDDLKIVYLKLEDLKPYENNARHHEEEDVKAIENSIVEFGFCDPIGVWGDDNVIVEGHGRLLAMQNLGRDKVPCIRLDHLTDEQRRAYALAHNKTAELSRWDFSKLEEEMNNLSIDMTGFGFEAPPQSNSFEIVEDEYEPEVPEEPKTKRGDIYKLGEHRLMCGDSTNPKDFAKLMNGENGRLCVTSPPYGVGMEYETKGIDPWRKTISAVIKLITKYCRIICWNIADLFATGTQFIEPTSMYSTEYMNDNHFNIMYARIWKKQGANFNGVNPYHIVSMKPVQEYEWILCYGKSDYKKDFVSIQSMLKAEFDKSNISKNKLSEITGAQSMYGHWFTANEWHMIDETNYNKIKEYCKRHNIDAFTQPYETIRRKYDDLNIYQKTLTDQERSDWGQWAIWNIPTVNSRDGHPAAFPIELPSRLIKMHSRECDIVIEPFCGSGTTLIACEQLNRKCYAMERDPKYCDLAVKRWETFTGRKAEIL